MMLIKNLQLTEVSGQKQILSAGRPFSTRDGIVRVEVHPVVFVALSELRNSALVLRDFFDVVHKHRIPGELKFNQNQSYFEMNSIILLPFLFCLLT